jgi:soluble lytic murein transglycosylase-like protein
MDAADIRGFEVEDYIPPTPAPAPPPPEVKAPTPSPLELADAAADKYGLPRLLVRRVMAAESGFQLDAVSPKGAIGLMQLMPGTAQILGANPNDPLQNVDAGARYLRGLLERYGGYLRPALAAYNAGPGAVSKFGGVPPYRETLNYVHRIETDLCRAGAVICSVKP